MPTPSSQVAVTKNCLTGDALPKPRPPRRRAADHQSNDWANCKSPTRTSPDEPNDGWSCRELKLMLYQAFWALKCRFVPSRSRSDPLITCGFRSEERRVG